MNSFVAYGIVTLAALPFVGLAMLSLRNQTEFARLCEMVAIHEGRLYDLRSKQDVSDGFNAYQVELHKRLMKDEFESCSVDEIARLATRLARNKRRVYGLFILYILLVGIPFLYFIR